MEFVEHDVEVLAYKTSEGKVVTANLPYKDDNDYMGDPMSIG